MYQNNRQTSYWLLSIVMVLFVGICAERFQTDYRLSFPQDVRTEAALKGEPPGSSEEQYFEETSLRDVSSEIFRQANRRTSSRTTDFLLFSGTSPAVFTSYRDYFLDFPEIRGPEQGYDHPVHTP